MMDKRDEYYSVEPLVAMGTQAGVISSCKKSLDETVADDHYSELVTKKT